MIVRRLLAVAVVVAATTLLTACPSPPPNPTPAPTTASPGPTPTPTPTLAADVAFVVSGTLVSPSGATEIAFRMTVGAPEAETPDDVAAFAVSGHCPPDALAETLPRVASAQYVPVVLETELVSGTVDADTIITTTTAPQTWDGGFRTFQAFCSDPLAVVPGEATGLLMVESGVATGQNGWIPAFGGYGLSASVVDPSTMDAVTYAVTACAIEFGPASVGTAAATLVAVDATYSCTYGLTDTP